MNLWADFDNQQLPVEETVRPKPRGRLTEQAMLSFLRSWLLQDYVPSYSRALAAMRFYRRCYWIDAWGVNPRLNGQAQAQGHTDTPSSTTTTTTAKGRKKEAVQPLLPPVLQPVAALSALLAQESKAIALYGIALTEGSSTRKDDKARLNKANSNMEDEDNSTTDHDGTLNRLVLPKESGMVGASWLEAGPALLQEIDQSPAIFLLNPFGQALFRYENLAPLYQRTAPTELCLLLSHKQIEAQLIAASRSSANASALTALLRSDRWKAFVSKDEKTAHGESAMNGLIELLVASMQKHFLSVQRIQLPVQTAPAILETAPYGLLFATRSNDSLACMNDAVCLYRRRLSRESYAGTLGEEWFMAQQRERDAEALQAMRERVLQLGRKQRTRRWPDLRQQVLLANFGQWTLHDYDAMIAALLSEGMIRCEWRGRRSLDEGEGTRIPGNEDTLSW
jgi:hypothetical protein